ncbi:MAG: DUF3709 domain-containing protein [Chitinispirillales bacterium]|nr:DUF3709 domain-containing protein [Chitinispirillales bacterium]
MTQCVCRGALRCYCLIHGEM